MTSSFVAGRGMARSLRGRLGFVPQNAMQVSTDLWMAGYRDEKPSLHRRSNLYRHGAVSLRQNPPPAFMRLVPGSTQSLVIQEQPQITRLQRVLRRSASAQSQRKGAVAPCSWTPQESQVERCEHQDDSNIHCQPFPESVSEEHEIYTDYDGCHRHHIKHDSYLSGHFSPWFNRNQT